MNPTVRTPATPAPWAVSHDGLILGPRDGSSHIIVARMPAWWSGKAPGEHASQDVQTANAALIVRAVNAHDDLVAALSRYGRHDAACPLAGEPNLPGDKRCSCGFSQALALAGGAP